MLKKLCSLLLIFTLIFSLSACAEEKRKNIDSFLFSMKNKTGEEIFSPENAYFSDEEILLFLSPSMLIKFSEDEGRRLCRITLSLSEDTEENRERFIYLSEKITESFLPPSFPGKPLAELSLYNKDILFKENALFYQEGRYKFTLFSCERVISLIAEYI